MSKEETVEKVAEVAEDVVDILEDVGLITEEQEAKYTAAIQKALPLVLGLIGGFLGGAVLV
jgi:hypothetical protein|tara:strand:- start:1852 stop:2034 length:183 start_codon:yes stop_codon:yes gene_type:complete